MRRIREGLEKAEIEPITPKSEGVVWILDENPRDWMARFGGALLAGRTVALGSPEMTLSERTEREAVLQTWDGSRDRASDPVVLVPTGGVSGRLRWAIHRWSSLCAAAEGFLQFFGTAAGASVCVLPLHHVGGFMAIIRGWVSGETVWHGNYREIGDTLAVPPGVTVSLVPTQLARLLDDPAAVEHLRHAGRILIGGAHLSAGVASRARAARLKLAPCYGMTETGALVTALPPFRFLSGQGGVGRPLPHVEVLWRENIAATDLHPEARRLGLRSRAVFEGYWPPQPDFERDPWWTSDGAYFDENGNLRIVGRIDRVIISGGENVDAERIERLLGEHLPGVAEFTVIGLPDPDWGQRVVAVLAMDPDLPPPDSEELSLIAKRWLAPAEQPKEWFVVPELPRTGLGKVDARRLQTQLLALSELPEDAEGSV